MSEFKILVCGDVNGNFKSLFSKVSSIIKKKGSFEYLFCVGNFFGTDCIEWEEVKSGKITVPLTTYVLGANENSHEKFFTSTDLAPNIVCLGKKGCLTGSSGFRIAYLSGLEQLESQSALKDKDKNNTNIAHKSIFFSKQDVNDMINSMESEAVIDILLTSQWPKGVTKYAVSIDDDDVHVQECSSGLVSHLSKVLKPRFHFSGLAGIYYERIPYRNHTILQEANLHVTRFIGLAPLSNLFQKKHKWLYALSIAPACSMSRKELTDFSGPVTICPYDFDKSLDSEKDKCQFFYNTTSTGTSQKNLFGRDHHQNKKLCTIDLSECWFCLSNSDVKKQLIISIGNHCYVTLAKGVLVPEHVLIVPIKHAVSSVELPDFIFEEIEKIKRSLICYYHEQDKDVVFFERNYSSPHLQIQAIPIPKNIKAELKEELFSASKNYNLEFTELPNFTHIQQVVSPKKSYFYLELIVNKNSESKYLHVIQGKFPLQFGRVVLASPKILNVEHRVDWRKCQDTVEEEKEMAEKMRKSFATFDLIHK